MNGAHLHLLVNHVSLFALLIGTVILAAAMIRKSSELRVLAVALFLVVGVFGWVASETGDQAEDIMKTVDQSSKPLIHEHEEAADWAQASGFLIAGLAIVTEWTARKKQKFSRPAQWLLLVFAVHGCTVFARTAFLGGLIRHSEVRANGQDTGKLPDPGPAPDSDRD